MSFLVKVGKIDNILNRKLNCNNQILYITFIIAQIWLTSIPDSHQKHSMVSSTRTCKETTVLKKYAEVLQCGLLEIVYLIFYAKNYSFYQMLET